MASWMEECREAEFLTDNVAKLLGQGSPCSDETSWCGSSDYGDQFSGWLADFGDESTLPEPDSFADAFPSCGADSHCGEQGVFPDDALVELDPAEGRRRGAELLAMLADFIDDSQIQEVSTKQPAPNQPKLPPSTLAAEQTSSLVAQKASTALREAKQRKDELRRHAAEAEQAQWPEGRQLPAWMEPQLQHEQQARHYQWQGQPQPQQKQPQQLRPGHLQQQQQHNTSAVPTYLQHQHTSPDGVSLAVGSVQTDGAWRYKAMAFPVANSSMHSAEEDGVMEVRGNTVSPYLQQHQHSVADGVSLATVASMQSDGMWRYKTMSFPVSAGTMHGADDDCGMDAQASFFSPVTAPNGGCSMLPHSAPLPVSATHGTPYMSQVPPTNLYGVNDAMPAQQLCVPSCFAPVPMPWAESMWGMVQH